MIRYFCMMMVVILYSTFVQAQTPEQLDMLRQRQEQQRKEQEQQKQLNEGDNKLDLGVFEKQMEEKKREDNQDKLVVTTDDFKIYESVSGMKLCTFQIGMTNYTEYPLEQAQVFLKWGDVETYVIFSDIAYERSGAAYTGLVGSVCDEITNKPELRTTTCQMKGASESFCKSAITYN